jgi:hypothetical protein
MRMGFRKAVVGAGRQRARWQKAAALLPLVVMSGALSASAATGGDGLDPASADKPGTPLVPATAFDQPASVAMPGGAMPGGLTAGLAPESDFKFATGDAPRDYRRSMDLDMNASVAGIPASALRAYQRAAAILDKADPSCNLEWPLVAAIGRVESDHGRYGGNALDAQGKARPGIYGIPLDGSNGTALIRDTDNGAYDKDPTYDRAIGPMQFIPGTWAVAGVDADQDGQKDPQDIDDAATSTGVYLCAGSDDLGTDSGKRAAVYRYNHSDDYVNLVLSIAAQYAGGDYTAVPNGTPSSTTLYPESFQSSPSGRPSYDDNRNDPPRNGARGGSSSKRGTDRAGAIGGSDGGSGGTGGTGGSGGSGGGYIGGGGGGGTGGSGGGTGGDGGGGSTAPEAPSTGGTVGGIVDGARDAVGGATGGGGGGGAPAPAPAPSPQDIARDYCSGQPLPLTQCVNAYLSGGAGAVEDLIGGGGGGIL